MHFGTPYASGFGSFQNMIRWDRVEASVFGRPHRVYFQPSPLFYGAYYGIYLNGIKCATYSPALDEIVGPIFVAPIIGPQSLQIVRQGHSADEDVSRYCRQEEAETSARATLSWTWPLVYVGPSASSSWLSAWALTDVSIGALDSAAQLGRFTVTFSLTVDTGIATVSLSNATGAVATGSGAVGTTIALSAVGANGFSGMVDVDVSATVEIGTLQWRRLTAMRILRDGVQVAQVAPTDNVDGRWTEPEDLTSATYSYTLRTLSDTGVEGSDSAPITVDLKAVPLPATAIHYDSGTAAALMVHWTASATTLASYNLYAQGVSDPYLDLNAAVALPTGTTMYALPAQVFPGIVRTLVRTVKGGVEERQGALLDIELDANGVRVPLRPNVPVFGTHSIVGVLATISGLYVTAYEEAAASHLQLFVRAIGGSYDYTSPAAEGALATISNGVKQAAISWTGTNGTWLCVLKARTSAGTQSEIPSNEIQIDLLNATIVAPVFTVDASRS